MDLWLGIARWLPSKRSPDCAGQARSPRSAHGEHATRHVCGTHGGDTARADISAARPDPRSCPVQFFSRAAFSPPPERFATRPFDRATPARTVDFLLSAISEFPPHTRHRRQMPRRRDDPVPARAPRISYTRWAESKFGSKTPLPPIPPLPWERCGARAVNRRNSTGWLKFSLPSRSFFFLRSGAFQRSGHPSVRRSWTEEWPCPFIALSL